MRIKLHFPASAIEAIKGMGLRQRNPETLRWTADHPGSSYGLGMVLRGKSGEVLSGSDFAAMVYSFGAWIEVDSEDAARRVRNALVTVATGTDGAVRVVDGSAS